MLTYNKIKQLCIENKVSIRQLLRDLNCTKKEIESKKTPKENTVMQQSIYKYIKNKSQKQTLLNYASIKENENIESSMPTQIKKQLDSCYKEIQNRFVIRQFVLLSKKIKDEDLMLLIPIVQGFINHNE